MSELKRLRDIQKSAFKQKLDEAMELKLFREFQIYLGLDKKYQFMVINECYHQQLLEAGSYAYSVSGNQPTAILFQLTLLDRYYWLKPKIDHFMKTGTYIIVIDKDTNLIVAGTGFVDLCDYCTYPDSDNYQQNYSKNYNDFKKVLNYGTQMFCEKNAEFNKLWTNKHTLTDIEIHENYGKWCCPGFFWGTPDVRNKGLMLFLFLISRSIVHELGYKYSFADAINERSVLFTSKSRTAQIMYIPIMIKVELDQFKGINLNQYLKELKSKYNYSDKKINELKKLSHNIFMEELQNKPKFYQGVTQTIVAYKKSKQIKSKI